MCIRVTAEGKQATVEGRGYLSCLQSSDISTEQDLESPRCFQEKRRAIAAIVSLFNGGASAALPFTVEGTYRAACPSQAQSRADHQWSDHNWLAPFPSFTYSILLECLGRRTGSVECLDRCCWGGSWGKLCHPPQPALRVAMCHARLCIGSICFLLLQLLPIPDSVPISPDDGEHADIYKLRIRVRGNLEWAPPRPQIIFNIHTAPT